MASKINILGKKEKRKGRLHKRELDIPGKKAARDTRKEGKKEGHKKRK